MRLIKCKLACFKSSIATGAVLSSCIGGVLVHAQGWPRYKEPTDIKAGQEVVLTGDPDADISDSRRLAVSYSKFASMCQRGDQLFVGRYLVNGADVSSLYLEVNLPPERYVLSASIAQG